MEEDYKSYIENETLSIITFYVEAYMSDSEKGFKTLEERRNRLTKLKKATHEVLQDSSDISGISLEEIKNIIKNYLGNERNNAEKRQNYEEEYALIEEILDGLTKEDKEEQIRREKIGL